MTRETTLESVPDLRRLYAAAALHRGHDGDTLPDERARLAARTVDIGNLAAYSHRCGFPVTGVLPLTYPHLLAFPLHLHVMSGEGFPLPLLGAVHIENVITVSRAVTVTDALDLTVWAQNLRPHRRGRQVDLVTEVSTAGETAWRGVSTYLARGTDHDAVQPAAPPRLDEHASIRPGPRWRLGADAGREYAAVSGDWNPIHVHALTARPLGFPSAIAHGMFTYATVVASLGSRLPAAALTSRVWFRKPVRLPGTARLRSAFDAARITSVLENRDGTIEHAVVTHDW